MITGPSRQRGLSLIGWVVVLIILAVFGTAAFRMVPAYMEYNTIRSAINSVLSDSKTALMSEREVYDAIGKLADTVVATMETQGEQFLGGWLNLGHGLARAR